MNKFASTRYMIPHLEMVQFSFFFLFWYVSTCMNLTRFLQGPETDPATVRKIRDAIDNQTEVTVQLINYTKSGMHIIDKFLYFIYHL